MPMKIAGFDVFFTCEPNEPRGFFCYPRILRDGQDHTAEALNEVFGQTRTFFEGLDEAGAKQHAIAKLTPVLEEMAERFK